MFIILFYSFNYIYIMNTLFQFARNDWRNIIRDASMRFFLTLPLLLFAMSVWGLPALINAQPFFAPYKIVLTMFLGIQGSIMMGFIFSIVLIEEREANLHVAFKVMPNTAFIFLLARLLPAASLAWLIGFLIILYNGVWEVDLMMAFRASILCLFPSPIITLLITSFAKNKVQGMTFFKVLDLLLVAPGLYFVIGAGNGWLELFRILPFWWVFAVMQDAFLEQDSYLFNLAIGFAYNIVFLTGLYYLFNKYYWK